MAIASDDIKPSDELPEGAIVLGRTTIVDGPAMYQALAFRCPDGRRVACYLDRLRNLFRVVEF